MGSVENLQFRVYVDTVLSDLDFLTDVIVETIVSTYSVDKQPHAAPMGVKVKDTGHVIIQPFTSTVTYRNLEAWRCAVVNVSLNPEVFYRTAFKDANLGGRIPDDWFEGAETVFAPRLRFADAHVEVSVDDIKPSGLERVEVLCSVKLVKASSMMPKAYCRAVFATIEAIIHATRVKFLLDRDGRMSVQVRRLLRLIKHYKEIVDHVAPNSKYSTLMDDLMQRVESWMVKS